MMRISFSCELKPQSGKQNFALRLAEEFKRIGIEITNKKPHVNLVFVKGFRRNCKNVLRLDGIWMNTRIPYLKKNRTLSACVRKADAVIYQNEFCKKAYDNFCLQPSCPYEIIPNGANPTDYFCGYEKKYFLALCKWRAHKRLKEIIEGFLQSKLSGEYKLIVCGKPDYIVKNTSIIYKGMVSAKKIQKLISNSLGTVHLAYIDWCPNSVVESLVAGKPVLHTSSGGTPLLVGQNGVCICDKNWDFKPIDLYSPPPLDRNEIAIGYEKLLDVTKFERQDLHISSIAKKYSDFIRKIL